MQVIAEFYFSKTLQWLGETFLTLRYFIYPQYFPCIELQTFELAYFCWIFLAFLLFVPQIFLLKECRTTGHSGVVNNKTQLAQISWLLFLFLWFDIERVFCLYLRRLLPSYSVCDSCRQFCTLFLLLQKLSISFRINHMFECLNSLFSEYPFKILIHFFLQLSHILILLFFFQVCFIALDQMAVAS